MRQGVLLPCPHGRCPCVCRRCSERTRPGGTGCVSSKRPAMQLGRRVQCSFPSSASCNPGNDACFQQRFLARLMPTSRVVRMPALRLPFDDRRFSPLPAMLVKARGINGILTNVKRVTSRLCHTARQGRHVRRHCTVAGTIADPVPCDRGAVVIDARCDRWSEIDWQDGKIPALNDTGSRIPPATSSSHSCIIPR